MTHSPAPWRFHKDVYGLTNAVVDAEKRVLVCHVPESDGTLMAAAPTMLAVLKRIGARLPEGDELGNLARKAISVAEPNGS